MTTTGKTEARRVVWLTVAYFAAIWGTVALFFVAAPPLIRWSLDRLPSDERRGWGAALFAIGVPFYALMLWDITAGRKRALLWIVPGILLYPWGAALLEAPVIAILPLVFLPIFIAIRTSRGPSRTSPELVDEPRS